MELARLFLLVIACLVVTGCGVEECRFDPMCGGGIGGLCSTNSDCDTDFCCTENGNCNDGMCTYQCEDDIDCPSDMRCEHKVCFFACVDDSECAVGMSCEHGNTVCEWP